MVGEAGSMPGNQFSRNAKFDEGAFMRLAFCFCQGADIARAAALGGVSAKTARALYIEFRARLAQPAFNRWHGAFQRLPRATSPDGEFLAREGFLDALSGCYFNQTCFRNFQLGNRKARLCRACCLPGSFTQPERVREALDVIDAVHAFYERTGIRGEKARNPVALFRLRLIHTTTIATALAASRKADGRLTPPDKPEFLSVWTLLDVLLTDLAARPL